MLLGPALFDTRKLFVDTIWSAAVVMDRHAVSMRALGLEA
jgi:hypothetical protein